MERQLDKNGYATMDPIVITAQAPHGTRHKDAHGKPVHGAKLHDHPPWCKGAEEIEAYYECHGPMDGECTVLIVNPNDPTGPKYRSIVPCSDIRLLDQDAAPPAPKKQKRAQKSTPTPPDAVK